MLGCRERSALSFIMVMASCGRATSEGANPPTKAPKEMIPARKAEFQGAKSSSPAPKVELSTPKPRWSPARSFNLKAGQGCPKHPSVTLGLLTSVERPTVKDDLGLLVSVFGNEGELAVLVKDAEGQSHSVSGRVRAGIPSIADLKVGALAAGKYQVLAKQGEQLVGCAEFRVFRSRRKPKAPRIERSQMWQATGSWTPAQEALYSAWLVMLFDADTHEDLAWSSMHEVTRDRARNWLWNRKGWGEDDEDGMKLRPDCADTPYFLRAYYAWKLGLPFVFHRCNRGTAKKAPRCRSSQSSNEPPIFRKNWLVNKGDWRSYKASISQALREGEPYPKYEGELKTEDPREVLEYFFGRTVGWGVHTGNGRVAWNDPKNDFYAVALTRDNLRPGTMYADPYGHILMLVDLHEGGKGRPSVLFAVDGQPDASITRKRFWQGNFLWNADPTLGGSGFKAFVPVVLDKSRKPRLLSAREIAARRGYAKRAGDLTRFSPVAFYDHMERLITPGVVEPKLALTQLVDALAEAVRIRVRSVQNGVDWAKANPGKEIEMPQGYKLFETTGAWENFSTPARDLRLLIAIDAVTGFPAKVGRTPEAYGVVRGQESKTIDALKSQLTQMLGDDTYKVSYLNSVGKPVELTLAQVVDRVKAFEVAYNPNDCPEIRWGAAPGKPEARHCKRRAPAEQRKFMQRYRPWFSKRRRPARGEQAP